ncbi:MAG: tetratricopeptide repeat protein [Acidobacteriota bacterium]
MSRKRPKVETSPEATPPKRRGATLAVYLVPALLGFLVYVSSLNAEFVWDDYNLIVENHWIKSLHNLKGIFTHDFFNRLGDDVSYGYYRPVVTMTYVLDYAAWGVNAWGYHLTNVLIHVASTLLVTALLLRIGVGSLATGIASALFAVHPIHTENVSWISGRTDLVAFLFCAAAFLLSLMTVQQTRPAIEPPGKKAPEPPPAGPSRLRVAVLTLLACASFALAMLSKEMSVVLIPWVALVALVRDRRPWSTAALRTLPFAAVFATYVIVRFLFLDVAVPDSVEEHTPRAIALSMAPTVVRYLSWMVYRSDLCAYVVNPYVTSLGDLRLPGALLVLAALALVVYSLRKNRVLLLLSLMGAISFAPIVNLVRISGPLDMGNVMAERFCYFPSFPLLGILGLAAVDLARRSTALKATAGVVLAVALALAAHATVRRNADWHDELTFFTKTLAQEPEMPLLLIRLAGAQIRARDLDGANLTLARVMKDAPANAGVLSVLASLHVARHEYDKAIPIMESLLQRDIVLGRMRAQSNLAFLYAATGQQGRAQEIWESMVQAGDDYASVDYNLAEIYRGQGKLDKARELYERAHLERPQDRAYVQQLAAVYRAQKAPARALAVYGELQRLYPNDAPILNNIAAIYEEMGASENALDTYQRSIKLDPNYLMARINCAALFEKLGRCTEAELELREVLSRGRHNEREEQLARLAEQRLFSLPQTCVALASKGAGA